MGAAGTAAQISRRRSRRRQTSWKHTSSQRPGVQATVGMHCGPIVEQVPSKTWTQTSPVLHAGHVYDCGFCSSISFGGPWELHPQKILSKIASVLRVEDINLVASLWPHMVSERWISMVYLNRSSKRQREAGAPHRTGRARLRHPALRFVVPRGSMRGGYVDPCRTARGKW